MWSSGVTEKTLPFFLALENLLLDFILPFSEAHHPFNLPSLLFCQPLPHFLLPPLPYSILRGPALGSKPFLVDSPGPRWRRPFPHAKVAAFSLQVRLEPSPTPVPLPFPVVRSLLP